MIDLRLERNDANRRYFMGIHVGLGRDGIDLNYHLEEDTIRQSSWPAFMASKVAGECEDTAVRVLSDMPWMRIWKGLDKVTTDAWDRFKTGGEKLWSRHDIGNIELNAMVRPSPVPSRVDIGVSACLNTSLGKHFGGPSWQSRHVPDDGSRPELNRSDPTNHLVAEIAIQLLKSIESEVRERLKEQREKMTWKLDQTAMRKMWEREQEAMRRATGIPDKPPTKPKQTRKTDWAWLLKDLRKGDL